MDLVKHNQVSHWGGIRLITMDLQKYTPIDWGPALGQALAVVNKAPWGGLLSRVCSGRRDMEESPGCVWRKGGKKMGIVLLVLLEIKQVEVLKIPLGRTKAVCKRVALSLIYSTFTKCLLHSCS